MLDAELLDLVFAAIKHTNRFVRETGYYVCGQFVVILNEDKIGDTSVVSLFLFPLCAASEKESWPGNGRRLFQQVRGGHAVVGQLLTPFPPHAAIPGHAF